MSLQEQNRSQGTGVTKDEIELIKSNLATVFSNGQNIFYEKGKINICESYSSNFLQMIDVRSLSKKLPQNCLM